MLTDDRTNKIYFSAWLPTVCPVLWENIHRELSARKVQHELLNGTADIWCRDYMPIQIDDNEFVNYRYTPDYLMVKSKKRYITNASNVCAALPYQVKQIDLILDGGNVVRCGDTVVMTEKVFHENKDKSRYEVEKILTDAFKCDLLFLPWDRSEPLGHSDGIVHYIEANKVMLTNYDDFSPYFFRRFKKALERKFEIVPLKDPTKRKHQRSWAYVNFLQTEHLLMVPQLGIAEDEQAIEQIGNAFPQYDMIGIPALEAVRRGGALNCISWNVKDGSV